MGKNKMAVIAICLVFIVFSGIFYIKPGVDGTGDSITSSTEAESTSMPESGSLKGKQAESTHMPPDIIAVYICGAVKHPGVYSLESGQRLCDAVNAAGGFKKTAARLSVNLAMLLSDGEQVIIPTKKQVASYNKTYKGNSAGGTASTNTDGLVNINTASRDELMSLPGIGASKADAVIEYRLSNSFKTIEDIKNVTGIKDGVFNQIKNQITV